MELQELERNIFVDTDIIQSEYDYAYGNNKDSKVVFVFHNTKTDKSAIRKSIWNYRQALSVARDKKADKRYKNYEYLIYKQ